ncbi:MAG: hypothetical protein HDQ88_05440 [Clostridia bacterium]|nr:hypothetical protein [Clostridia bacterium]
MGIFFEKLFAQLLFWLYDFIDTIYAIFNILTGTQQVEEGANGRSLLEVFVESAISTKVMIGLCMVSVVIAGACVGVRTVKNIIKIKGGGEPSSHTTTIKQGVIAVLSSVACIFFVILFIAFANMVLNMVNDVIAPPNGQTLSQSLFDLSVEQSYVIDESTWDVRYSILYDDDGKPVQAEDPNGFEGLKWEMDENGNYVTDKNGDYIPVYKQKEELYHPYLKDSDGNLIMETGWVDGHTAADIEWYMTPNDVFGIHNKDWIGLFEVADKGYEQEPMVRLESFNLFTAYLVAIIMLISVFMLCVGLVKRIYDIIVLIICMPLVCGTIPLDDGARFRAWRETMMSKVLIAFGAVISLNVFFMISGYIVSPAFDMTYLVTEGILNDTAVGVFKMLMLLGGAVCINGSQALIARILGTSADEGREAMQAMTLISSGVRMGAVGALGVGRLAMGGKRALFGGTNRYGRQRTGAVPMLARGANAVGEKVGGDRYSGSRGARFMRTLGRMGGKAFNATTGASKNQGKGFARPGAISAPSSHKSDSAYKR